MALDLEQFTPTGRAQLVNDFCYFAAHNEVPNADRIRSKVFDIVSLRAYFEKSVEDKNMNETNKN